jgi:outer membrane protein
MYDRHFKYFWEGSMKSIIDFFDSVVEIHVQKVIFFIIPFLIFPFCLHAMSLSDVYRQAVENDPTFQSYQFRTFVAQEGKRQALAAMLPAVVGSAGYVHQNQDIVSSDNEVYSSGSSDYGTTTYGVTLTQPLFDWAAYLGWKQAEVVRLRSEVEYLLAGQELITRVADLYFQALTARDRLDYAVVEQTAVEKHFELAQSRLDMGLIPITDLHDAKARLATTEAQTIAARNDLSDALQALSEVTGGDVADLAGLGPNVSFTGPEPAILDEWLGSAMDGNPAIELARKAVEAAELEVERRTAGHYPTLDLVGSYDTEDTEDSLFGGSSEVQTFKIGVQFTMPIYQGGEVSSRVRSARHEVSIARQELVKQTRSVDRKTRSAFLGVDSALKRVDALAESVRANRLALEAKQEGFMSGLFTSLAVLDAERDLALVSIDHAQARYDYILNSLRLRQAVGTLAEADLAELENWLLK